MTPKKYDETSRDPYQGVVIVLLTGALVETIAVVLGGVSLNNPVLFAVAAALVISTGVLLGVFVAQWSRQRPLRPKDSREAKRQEKPAPKHASSYLDASAIKLQLESEIRVSDAIRIGTAVAGFVLVSLLMPMGVSAASLSARTAVVAGLLLLAAAGLAAITVRYLSNIDPELFAEAPGLCRGARVLSWVFVFASVSMTAAWMGQKNIIRLFAFIILLIDAAFSMSLVAVKSSQSQKTEIFPLDLEASAVLGRRTNILASLLDSAEQQFGIDLRSTWAFTVVRQSLEPLFVALLLIGWFSTSFTVVASDEQGLLERVGVAVGDQPLQPGLHFHWPWPIDRVFRIPVRRVQTLEVGHEGDEGTGPENVLWAVEHAPNEYTLVLGNGRDLITVDAAVQYRIRNARAWHYHCQNPSEALRAIAYRAVMRSTVNRTLSEALSEHLVTLTGQMRAMVEQDASALDLGVEILDFTIGGMHPPVAVAKDYQAVVSAELRKVTAVVNAQAGRNKALPEATASVIMSGNTARADSAEALARAAGEAWSFRTIETQYRAAPADYFFRRRLETLENGLSGRNFTVVDSRFQRDGGELWLVP